MKFNLKTVVTTSGILGVLGIYAYDRKRKKRQKDLQNRVDKDAPTPLKKDLLVKDHSIQLTLANNVDLADSQELPMSEDEAQMWETLISTISSETTKAAFTVSAFDGLLRCDIPFKELCQIKENPEVRRGFVINNGKISKHASFSEAKWSNVAPLLAYQCAAIITSQYYQQIITDRLNSIEAKIDKMFSL